MATIDNKGRIRGTAGSVVYRMYREKNIVQGKPRKIKQSKKSVRTSTEFGLSSSSAAVIRRAFEEAYVHRDGKAASRSTKQVYHSIRNSTVSTVGKRDLHDADISLLEGMEFNTNCKLNDLIPINNTSCEVTDAGVRVILNNIGPMYKSKKPARINEAASLYRIRLVLIGFNFRKEYFEYLGIQDIDMRSRKSLEEQVVNFGCGKRPELLMMVSMSVLAYKETRMKEGLVLLNSKQFSPCAIIAAFPAEDPGSYPQKAVEHDFSWYPEPERESLNAMGYEGNRLMLALPRRLSNGRESTRPKEKSIREPQAMIVGKRVSFT